MAKIILTQAKILIAAVDLSDHIEQVTLSSIDDEVEVTSFGGTYHDFLTGLQANTLALTFQQDFGISSVQQTIWPLIGTVAAFSVNATKGANSTINPSFLGNVLISNWLPLDGQIGALSKNAVTWKIVSLITQATT